MIHDEELLKIMPYAKGRIPVFSEFLNSAMKEFDIDTPLREAAFIAQIAQESGQLRYVKEIASGDAYEGRKDLGNDEPGDGEKYKGRGLIQLTGKANYKKLSDAFGVDFVSDPALLEEPHWACRSAAWFWHTHGLNELADKEDIVAITKRINGGLNGYSERLDYYTKALNVMESA